MKRLILILTLTLTLLASPAYAGEDQECRQMLVQLAATSHEGWRDHQGEIERLHEVIDQMLTLHDTALSRINKLEARIRQLEGRR